MKKIILFYFIFAISIPFSAINAQNSLYLIATITGEKVGDRVGGVEWAGDVNGDGFDDVLINWIRGSWSYFSLYYGGAPFDTVADTKLTQGRASGAGDVNADGYNDILVEKLKSPQEDPYDGRLYVYLGGPDMLTLSNFEFADDYRFCPAGVGKVGGIGDVNKDGFDDFIYSSVYNWCDGMARIYLFLGGDTLDSQPKLTFMTNKLGDDFGASGAGGDVNGDGYDDLIIGAPIGAGGMDYDTSKVMIYFGGREMDIVADVILSGDENGGDNFGFNISSIGDANDDGFDDFLVSADSKDKVYLFLGSENISKEIVRYEFSGAHDFGIASANLGDINNDNFTDFMIYAGGDPLVGNPPQIAVNIYLGSATFDTIPDIVFTDQRGYCSQLAGPGDVNGDGYRDIIFGDVNYAERGRVRIFSVQPISHIDRSNEESKPEYFRLEQNYPNPFNAETWIRYNLQDTKEVTIAIYNVSGSKVRTLIKGDRLPGTYRVKWDGWDDWGRDVSSGVYVYQLRAGQKSLTRKLLLVR